MKIEHFNRNAPIYKNIFDNSLSLIEDAEILLDAGRTRRAGALAIISVEELIKFMIVCENPEDKRAFYHKHKFAPFNEAIEHVISVFKPLISAALASKELSEKRELYLNLFEKHFFDDLRKKFDLESARHKLLNEDPIPSGTNYIDLSNQYASVFIPFIKGTLLEIQKVFDLLPLSPESPDAEVEFKKGNES